MLTRLRIENLAVVENVEIELGPGLNVLTGSTGAGKSLVLGALNLLLGEKADASTIREGCDEARVDAEFSIAGLPEAVRVELSLDRAARIGVSRRVTRAGRSYAAIDGRAVPLKDARRVCSLLVEPHGQNEQYRLRDPSSHVQYVDAFAQNHSERARYAQALSIYRAAQAELARFDTEVAAARERRELLVHRLDDIDRIAPKAGEKESLTATARMLAHAEKIHAAMAEAVAGLYDDEASASSTVGRIDRRIAPLASLEPRIAEMASLLAQARAALDAAASLARGIVDGLDFEPAEVERLQERIDVLARLEQRYRVDVDSLIAQAQEWRESLDTLEDAGERRKSLSTALAAAKVSLVESGETLTRTRLRAGSDLDARVTQELARLHMRGATFRTEIAHAPDDGSAVRVADNGVAVFDDGLDVVRMRARTNPGEAEGGIEAIASTGELSRIGLVLKSIASSEHAGTTIVFDEIDAGVGADLGDVLAEKLLALAERHQILCITHMPQIAARASLHVGVAKDVDGARTRVTLRRLHGDDRTREIARMLGGDGGSDHRRALARELLASVPRKAPTSSRVRP